MPELPEVETVRRHLASQIKDQLISKVIVREYQLRWPIPPDLAKQLVGWAIKDVKRRGKYLLLITNHGTLIIHLGMSGSLRILSQNCPVKNHDHVDIIFTNSNCLRFNDPRRFGAILWATGDPLQHELLAKLGPEPLTADFSSDYLYQRSRTRKIAIKSFIMDSHVVTGIGNIYANEALFLAGINPHCAAGQIAKPGYQLLVKCIKQVLTAAIEKNGTTFRDFISSNGETGQFASQLKVYGRAGLPCVTCKTTLREVRLGQRNTIYCPVCQS